MLGMVGRISDSGRGTRFAGSLAGWWLVAGG